MAADRDPRASRLAGIAVAIGLAIFVLARLGPVVTCADSCFVDYFGVHRSQTAHFELPDVRLNTWILGWVQHAAFAQPTSLFDANAFHPARNTLSGSEHLIGIAVQTLPLRLFSRDPVLLHQGALILSFVVLALTTFALVRGVFGSTWGATVAGATAAFMPWRFSELGHLQLLSVQWLPLVWLLAFRVLAAEIPRRTAWLLGAALSVQMLSSFYLGYIAVFSTAVLAGVLCLARRPPGRAIARFVAAVAVPAALTAWTAVPYLARFTGFRFREASATDFFTDPAVTLSLLAPPLALPPDAASIAPLTYHVPLAVLVLAAAASLWWRIGDDEARARDARVLVVAFAVMIVGGFVLMLGRQVQIGDALWRMPAHWLAQVVPGFSQMRAEFRWGIVLGLAFPVLAGAGVAALERGAGRLASAAAANAARVAVWGTSALALALGVVWFELPSRAAWADAPDVRAAHRAVAALDRGPIVEIPWRMHRINTAMNGSRYMQATAEHWWPILNGYSAYVPPSHALLQRIARGLPTRHAAELLSRLAGVRWVIVHPGRLGMREGLRWGEGVDPRVLRLAVEEPGYRIYEVMDRSAAGVWREALLRPAPGATTLTGLPRAPVALPDRPGRIEVALAPRMRFELDAGLVEFASVAFTNPAPETWPGLDLFEDGLVMLRYRFYAGDGEPVHTGRAPFDRDLPGGRTTRAVAAVRPPAREGRFRVRFDVVQVLPAGERDLGFAAVERTAIVTERKHLPGGLD